MKRVLALILCVGMMLTSLNEMGIKADAKWYSEADNAQAVIQTIPPCNNATTVGSRFDRVTDAPGDGEIWTILLADNSDLDYFQVVQDDLTLASRIHTDENAYYNPVEGGHQIWSDKYNWYMKGLGDHKVKIYYNQDGENHYLKRYGNLTTTVGDTTSESDSTTWIVTTRQYGSDQGIDIYENRKKKLDVHLIFSAILTNEGKFKRYLDTTQQAGKLENRPCYRISLLKRSVENTNCDLLSISYREGTGDLVNFWKNEEMINEGRVSSKKAMECVMPEQQDIAVDDICYDQMINSLNRYNDIRHCKEWDKLPKDAYPFCLSLILADAGQTIENIKAEKKTDNFAVGYQWKENECILVSFDVVAKKAYSGVPDVRKTYRIRIINKSTYKKLNSATFVYHSNWPDATTKEEVVTKQQDKDQFGLLANPFSQPKGYHFAGWTAEIDPGVVVQPGSVPRYFSQLDCTYNLYAVWKPYYVCYKEKLSYQDIDGNYTEEYTITRLGLACQTVTMNLREREGFEIDKDLSNLTETCKEDGSTVLHAYYKRCIYSVALNLNLGEDETPAKENGGEITRLEDVSGKYKEKIDLPVLTRKGYSFAGWSEKENSNTGSFSYQVMNQKTLYAVWIPDGESTYKVTHIYQGLTQEGDQSESETGYGEAGTSVMPERKEKKGFITPAGEEVTIAGDGTTSIIYTYKRETYTIKFNTGCNESENQLADQKVKFEDMIADPNYQGQKTGYQFAGFTNSHGKNVVFPYQVTEDETFNAIWEPLEYTFKFNPNEATSGIMNDQIAHYSETVTLSPNQYAREGYQFAGWSESKDGEICFSDKADLTKTLLSENREYTLYAIWVPQSYKVTFDENDADSGQKMADQNFIYGVKQKLSENTFSKTGYQFQGWVTNEDGTGQHYDDQEEVENLTTENNGKVTLYAKWVPRDDTPYQIVYRYEQLGGANDVEDPVTYKGTTGSTLEIPFCDKLGYVRPEAKNITILADGSATGYYEYKLEHHKIEFLEKEGGKSLADSQMLAYGSSISWPTLQKEGSTLWGYTINGTNYSLASLKTFTMGIEDLVAIPVFVSNAGPAIMTYTVTYLDGAGKVFDRQTYYSGQLLTYISNHPDQTSNDGVYTFTGWNIEEGTIVTSNLTVKPLFSYQANETIVDGDNPPLSGGDQEIDEGNNTQTGNNNETGMIPGVPSEKKKTIQDNKKVPLSDNPLTGDAGVKVPFFTALAALACLLCLRGKKK